MTMRLTATVVLNVVLVLGMTGVVIAGQSKAASTTPAAALEELLEGNHRFVSGTPLHPDDHSLRREKLLEGQNPIAAILSCSDSRVPPEAVFDQGLGVLFTVRVAGNTVDEIGLQSLEYAVSHLHTPLIIVMGHDSCGAVQAAVNAYPKLGVGPMIANIYPAIVSVHNRAGSLLDNAINANVINQVKLLAAYQPFAQRISQGELQVVGMRYNLKSGEVRLLTR
jgi:carbonic anhydrase